MSQTGFKVSGTRETLEGIKSLVLERKRQARANLFNKGQDIIDDAKQNYVPVDEGDLRDTGKVTGHFGGNQHGNQYAISLSFGDESTPQAIAIHEYPSESNPPSWEGVDVQFKPEGRGHKYLEKPLYKALPNLLDDISEGIK